jgi:hypothetical protein
VQQGFHLVAATQSTHAWRGVAQGTGDAEQNKNIPSS